MRCDICNKTIIPKKLRRTNFGGVICLNCIKENKEAKEQFESRTGYSAAQREKAEAIK